MKEILANLWLEKDKHWAVHESIQKMTEEKVILEQAQAQPMDEQNGARTGSIIPIFGYPNEVSVAAYVDRCMKGKWSTYSRPL